MAIVSETRDVSGFDEISLEGFGNLFIEQGGAEGLTVKADQDLMPHIKTEVVNGRLVIGYKNWLDRITMLPFVDRKADFHVQMKAIKAVRISGSGALDAERIQAGQLALGASGSGDFRIGELQADELEVSVSGSGRYKLGGNVRRQALSVSGAGQVDALGLASQEAVVRISGTAEVNINVQQSLNLHISGAGKVRYQGSPQITQSISGIGQVERVEGR